MRNMAAQGSSKNVPESKVKFSEVLYGQQVTHKCIHNKRRRLDFTSWWKAGKTRPGMGNDAVAIFRKTQSVPQSKVSTTNGTYEEVIAILIFQICKPRQSISVFKNATLKINIHVNSFVNYGIIYCGYSLQLGNILKSLSLKICILPREVKLST